MAREAPLYETSLDRAGLALGLGGLLTGLAVLGFVLAAGQRAPAMLCLGFALGAGFGTIGITAVAGPLWLSLHLLGLRGPGWAATLALFAAVTVFVAGQTYGFGLGAMPALDDRTLLFRWLSALATSFMLATIAVGIALAMWRVAYRRVL